MRILILANNDIGLYQFRRQLIYELLKKNEVFIALPYGQCVNPLIDAGCSFIDVKLERRGKNPLSDLAVLVKYRKILTEIKPDMVITYTIKPNVYGGLACSNKRIPYCANVTGLGTAFEDDGWLRKMAMMLNKAALKKARVVFFENSENQRFFIEEKIIKERQAYLLNGAGVDLDHFSLLPYPEDIDEIRFLFIGRLMKEKGIEETIEAIRQLREEGYNCSLDVLGFMEEDYSVVLQKYENEGWLHYHGLQEDVRPFIASCHCFVLPSYHEGMANTNLETAASGRPVITSDIPGCREAVADGISGFLCKAKDTESLVNALKKLLALSILERKTMGLEGRSRMEKLFDKKQVVNETLEAIVGNL